MTEPHDEPLSLRELTPAEKLRHPDAHHVVMRGPDAITGPLPRIDALGVLAGVLTDDLEQEVIDLQTQLRVARAALRSYGATLRSIQRSGDRWSQRAARQSLLVNDLDDIVGPENEVASGGSGENEVTSGPDDLVRDLNDVAARPAR